MTDLTADKTAVGVLDAGEATQMLAEPQTEATQYAASVDCPVCHTANPPSETYCLDCGFLLASEPVQVGEIEEIPVAARLISTDGLREFVLKNGENTVGRENADILLAHNTVSRRHATVTVADGRAFVQDLGSTNGTFVDGARLAEERVEAKNGAELTFGNAMLRLEIPAAYEPAEEAVEEVEPEPGAEAESEGPESECAKAVSEAEPAEIEQGKEALEAASVEPVARLVSKDGSLDFPILPGVNRIGRREGANEIVIADPYCSGRHADLSAGDGLFTLTDVGSTNGTFVNGIRLDPNAPKELQPDDEITLGQIVFKIEVV